MMHRPHYLWHWTFTRPWLDPLLLWLSRGDWRHPEGSRRSAWRFALYIAWARRAHWAVEDESVYAWQRQQVQP